MRLVEQLLHAVAEPDQAIDRSMELEAKVLVVLWLPQLSLHHEDVTIVHPDRDEVVAFVRGQSRLPHTRVGESTEGVSELPQRRPGEEERDGGGEAAGAHDEKGAKGASVAEPLRLAQLEGAGRCVGCEGDVDGHHREISAWPGAATGERPPGAPRCTNKRARRRTAPTDPTPVSWSYITSDGGA
jgi:hypothetical protein